MEKEAAASIENLEIAGREAGRRSHQSLQFGRHGGAAPFLEPGRRASVSLVTQANLQGWIRRGRKTRSEKKENPLEKFQRTEWKARRSGVPGPVPGLPSPKPFMPPIISRQRKPVRPQPPQTPYELRLQTRRRQILQAALPLLQRNLRQFEVARRLKVSRPTLCRLLKRGRGAAARVHNARACEWLLAQDVERLGPPSRPGKKSHAGNLLRSVPVRLKLFSCYVAVRSLPRPRRVSAAIRAFAKEPEYPKSLATRIDAGFQPSAFRSFLKLTFEPAGKAKVAA